ncbi:hypothetical protein PMAYCL1PPCAC_13734, partial [Pristionchus mayeri]
KAAGKTLGDAYDYTKIQQDLDRALKQHILAGMDGAVKQITATTDAGKFFCDAIDEKVEEKVKALFASEVSFLMAEFINIGMYVDERTQNKFEKLCQTK